MRRLAVGLWLLVGGVSVVAGQGRDDFHWSRALAPGKTLEIIGISGDVDARGGSGREAVVTAVKRARHSDPEDVRIEVVEHADGVTICAVYPSWRDSRHNECLPGGKGHHETHDNDVKVHFTVTVPRGVIFVGRTVNGGVEATGLDAAAEVHSVNGSVTLETSSYGSATTVNGSVHARLGQADWDDELEFTTVNGRIDLTLPSGTNADVKAHTVNGGLEADFPVTVRGKWGPKRIQGTIGRGGRSLVLSTVNGSMEIRRAN
jgi:hypothetical protein